MRLIPSPIPLPERAELIAAGKLACACPMDSPERKAARVKLDDVTKVIRLRYGVNEPERESS